MYFTPKCPYLFIDNPIYIYIYIYIYIGLFINK